MIEYKHNFTFMHFPPPKNKLISQKAQISLPLSINQNKHSSYLQEHLNWKQLH